MIDKLWLHRPGLNPLWRVEFSSGDVVHVGETLLCDWDSMRYRMMANRIIVPSNWNDGDWLNYLVDKVESRPSQK
jgi:hypothetical protein